MKTIEYNFTDKSEWGHGAWQHEPDKKQWQDKETGLPCLVHRAPSGALCGYVGVSKGHPSYEAGYDELDVDVHGGLTYSDLCQETEDESHGICHVVPDNEKVWWLGFDCAHYMDYLPAFNVKEFSAFNSGGTYKPMAYVVTHVELLAKQLAAS